jgi:RNA polymerase sigma factor (sigma-70 family)
MNSNNDLIIKYIRLAHKIAAPFCRGFPKSAEEIKSAALEGLCRGARLVEKRNQHEFAGQIIYLTIKGYVLSEVNKIPLIRVPASQIKKHRLHCYIKGLPFKIRDLYPEIFNDPDLRFSAVCDGFYNQKIKEALDHLRLSIEEQEVLDLRLSDATVREIAEELHYSKSKIQKIIERIRVKWRRKFS